MCSIEEDNRALLAVLSKLSLPEAKLVLEIVRAVARMEEREGSEAALALVGRLRQLVKSSL